MSIHGDLYQTGPSPVDYKNNREIFIQHAEEFKKEALEKMKDDLDGICLSAFSFIGVMYRPESKTSGGIYIPESHLDNQQASTKAFLIAKMGAYCFNEESAGRDIQNVFKKTFDEDGNELENENPKLHSWVAARPCDGWKTKIAGVECKIFYDRSVRMTLKYPRVVW